MRAANPKAKVRVLWLNTWFDPARERAAAQALVDQGADVLTHHSGSTAVAQVAEANSAAQRVRVIAYPSDTRAFAPAAQVTAIVHRWGGFYARVAESVRAGTWTAELVWGGIVSGLVDIAALDPALPEPMRAAVQARREAIVTGRLRPFSGPSSTTPAGFASRPVRSPTRRSSRWTGSSKVSSAGWAEKV